MPEFTVRHAYASNHNGRRFGPWAEGDVIDLDAVDAEWLNRDSEGVLCPVGEVAGVLLDGPEVLGEAVNAETGEVTAPGEPLPDLPESAYPADAVALEPVAEATPPAAELEPEPVVEEKPKRTRSRS